MVGCGVLDATTVSTAEPMIFCVWPMWEGQREKEGRGVHKEQVTRRGTHEDVIVELPRCSFRLEIVPNGEETRSRAIRYVPTGIMYW
ncbi:hypothetical protein PpBr36_04988 [Pyricularia pennisetigena]|uniref:hypothetical protein n=1 Tax=Pyricularia pennisetigena TaxID=1578925 RepID=UPI001152E5B9|nr:hypothetical protein PpBr36_04988 [Pyricularia pennisetigena]TLS27426.1 hypothetical protein PpBr36_04988 [Pyricularia pennisetigena]